MSRICIVVSFAEKENKKYTFFIHKSLYTQLYLPFQMNKSLHVLSYYMTA